MQGKIIIPHRQVFITSAASVAGHEENAGPLAGRFDITDDGDDRFGMDSFEKSEAEMQRLVLNCAMNKLGVTENDVEIVFAGDLLNQCVSSAYAYTENEIPFLGLFGACSTAAEGLLMASVFTSFAVDCAAAVTSSHNCTSERQFRFPLEYGAQRPPTAQWTVTGAGAFIVSADPQTGNRADGLAVEIAAALPGISRDFGINDANDMGAAMAPSAADTILRYLSLSGTSPEDYDLILTGDLGQRGSELLRDLTSSHGVDISQKHADCGVMIYDIDGQDKHSGGSGCGCSAVVLAADIIPRIRAGELGNVLFIGTGALMNPQALMQGENIVGIAHLVHLKGVK